MISVRDLHYARASWPSRCTSMPWRSRSGPYGRRSAPGTQPCRPAWLRAPHPVSRKPRTIVCTAVTVVVVTGESNVNATRDPLGIDCNCLASSPPIENVLLEIMVDFSPAGPCLMDGTWMTTELAVTDSTMPVVIPHCASHPLLGGKVLQSHADVHPLRWQSNRAATRLRTNLSVFVIRSAPAVDLRTPTTRCI